MKHSYVNLEVERMLWLQGIERIAGVDEAGRGPLAGPVVAASVIFPKEFIIDGVDDSKKCSPKQREAFFSFSETEIQISTPTQVISDRLNPQVNSGGLQNNK